MQGVIFRSQARWYNEGEAVTKYFFNLEKSKASAKGMSSLIKESGEECRNPRQILYEQERFYRKLYKSEVVHNFDYQNDQNIKISPDICQKMAGEFKAFELKEAIKSMKRNKVPGIDGLTAEFYVIFIQKLLEPLLAAIKHAFRMGSLYQSATKGVIMLIPKKNKDSRYVANLRPITLLNVDYKAIEKMLASRLKPALDEIVNIDQKEVMSKRRISCNIRRILTCLH